MGVDAAPTGHLARMPGDFEPHAMTYVGWPSRPDAWRLNAGPIQQTVETLALAIARFEPVTVLAESHTWSNARRRLPDEIRVIEMSFDDPWLRDQFPSFLLNPNGHRLAVEWRFNSWGGEDGGCFSSWELDDAVSRKILEVERIAGQRSNLVLEGGAITVDGQGTLITTESCLLNPNRNPGLSREDVERELRERLKVESIVWLPEGIAGDTDTDGHVDNLCAFVRPAVVALAWEEDPTDPQYAVSHEAEEILSTVRDARGRSLEIVRLVQPPAQRRTRAEVESLTPGRLERKVGEPLPASYINFCFVNGGVIVPAFDSQPSDQRALDTLAALLPGTAVRQISVREMLLGGGGPHCMTAHLPEGRPNT